MRYGSAWLNQLEIAELFATTKQNVSLHIKNVLEEGELDEAATVKESLTVQAEGKRQVKRKTLLYNLHMILAVGYRVRSPRGTQFRQWATLHLAEYLVKGFVMDDERLKNPGGWDCEAIDEIRTFQDGSPQLGDALLEAASQKWTSLYRAVETILKGGVSFRDKDGTERHEIRVRWWDHGATTYKEAFMGPESARTHIPEDEIHGDHLVEYAHDEPPVFLGHYWLEGEPAPLAPNIACLDYSVAKPGGKLQAYRWDGEQVFNADKFTWVERVES